jgi:hypothetical protein
LPGAVVKLVEVVTALVCFVVLPAGFHVEVPLVDVAPLRADVVPDVVVAVLPSSGVVVLAGSPVTVPEVVVDVAEVPETFVIVVPLEMLVRSLDSVAVPLVVVLLPSSDIPVPDEDV